MKSTITITPISNIKDSRVIDNEKITVKTYDSLMDVFLFYNIKNEETRKSNLMDVSLFDDLIVQNDEQYKILHMLTK